MRNEKFSNILHKVANLVQSKKYEVIVPEMLIWVNLSDDRFIEIAKFCNAKIDVLRENISDFLSSLDRTEKPEEVVSSEDYGQIIKRCASLADRNFEDVNIEHILFAILETDPNLYFGSAILHFSGFTKEKIQSFLDAQKRKKQKIEENYLYSVTDKARDGKIDPMIGRQKELSRIIQILHKKRACNPILLSQPGVGKTSLVEGLALAIVSGQVPDSLKDKNILSVNIGGMISGTKYRGDFEDRLTKIISKAVDDKNTILFIDEIHSIVGAGSTQENSLDAASILKPYLTDHSLKIIGATTYEEYKKYILKDKAFARRFKKIDLQEPSRKETLDILLGIRSKFEEFHGVKFSEEILSKIVELSGDYIPSQFFPDKAIEVMDEIGSRYSSGLYSGTEAKPEDVEEVICSIANLPEITIKSSGKEGLKTLSDDLKMKIFGQDDIIDQITYHIKVAKAGLTSQTKPLGCFGLLGPTGTGKTELVKQISKILGVKFLRYDMSEYSEKNSISKLIGAAPGYVGFDQSGALTEPVIQNPECVILFDEIEKANPEIYNLLLQVMDDGRLTDNQNRTADFTHSILFFTSNVGSREAESAKPTLGFMPESKKEDILQDSLKNLFPPEFRNRFTSIFRFSSLGEGEMVKIVEKNISELNQKLSQNGNSVELTEKAKLWIAKLAKEENMGGRPVERLVHVHIAEKLVDKILFENWNNSVAIFDVSKNGKELLWKEKKSKDSKIEQKILSEAGVLEMEPEKDERINQNCC